MKKLTTLSAVNLARERRHHPTQPADTTGVVLIPPATLTSEVE